MAEDGDLERHDGHNQRGEQRKRGVARALLQIGASLGAPHESRDRSPQAHEKREPEGQITEQRHLGLTHDFHRVPPIGRTAIAHLPKVIASPAPDYALRVGTAGRSPTSHHREGVVSDDGRRGGTVLSRRGIADGAPRVISPTECRAFRGHAARMRAPGVEPPERPSARHRLRSGPPTVVPRSDA